jgi:predicted anti-sigma-YlaC factor YlaD
MITASKTLKSPISRTVLAATIALSAAILPATQAGAVSAGVRYACAGDYLANCSAYAPDSAETRRCMRKVGLGLSRGCLNALVAAGEAPKSAISARSAKR